VTPVRYPTPSGDEWALACDRGRTARLLIVPALLEEANRLRRLAVEVMRRLDAAGIDSLLPDLHGCNESLQPLHEQTPQTWQAAMDAAASHFLASHVLALRGGCLFAPVSLPGWSLAPVSGSSLLRQMLRARIVAAREAGRDESQESLHSLARSQGWLELSGYRLSATFLDRFAALPAPEGGPLTPIAQADLGGSALWLRAEPDFEPSQADALATILIAGLTA